jgi:Flp pilus assembly protein TadD
MSIDAKPYYKKSFLYLSQTNDSLLAHEKLHARLQRSELYERARKLYRQFEFGKAVEVADELLRLAPDISTYHNLIGFYKLRLNKFEESIAHLNTAISLHPDSYQYNNRGFAYLMTGDLQNAYKNFMISMELDSKNSFLYRNFGIYFTKTKDYPAARINFDKASELDPKTELIHYFTGLLKLETNEREEAINEFRLSSEIGEPEGIKKLNELKKADGNYS